MHRSVEEVVMRAEVMRLRTSHAVIHLLCRLKWIVRQLVNMLSVMLSVVIVMRHVEFVPKTWMTLTMIRVSVERERSAAIRGHNAGW